jgi:hypothetical protein
MGHADRPRLDYALCVDTQSGGVRLPANERSESNPDSDGYSCRYGDANSHSHSHSNSYSDTYTHRHGYTSSKADSDSTTAA